MRHLPELLHGLDDVLLQTDRALPMSHHVYCDGTRVHNITLAGVVVYQHTIFGFEPRTKTLTYAKISRVKSREVGEENLFHYIYPIAITTTPPTAPFTF